MIRNQDSFLEIAPLAEVHSAPLLHAVSLELAVRQCEASGQLHKFIIFDSKVPRFQYTIPLVFRAATCRIHHFDSPVSVVAADSRGRAA